MLHPQLQQATCNAAKQENSASNVSTRITAIMGWPGSNDAGSTKPAVDGPDSDYQQTPRNARMYANRTGSRTGIRDTTGSITC
jgi:hypothetical protein